MEPIYTEIENCDTCEGSGIDVWRTNAPFDLEIDGKEEVSFVERHEYGGRTTRTYKIHQGHLNMIEMVDPCYNCKGYGVMTKNHTTYKSEALAKKGIEKRTARFCTTCQRKGKFLWIPTETDCFGCNATGKTAKWVEGNTHIHPEVSYINTNITPEFYKEWIKSMAFVLIVDDKWTWGDMHLGLGGLFSCTDYGTFAKMVIADGEQEALRWLRNDLLERRGSMISFNKCSNKETRRIANVMAVRVTHMGYQPIPVTMDQDGIDVADQTRVLLPPTYTPEVLNREV